MVFDTPPQHPITPRQMDLPKERYRLLRLTCIRPLLFHYRTTYLDSCFSTTSPLIQPLASPQLNCYFKVVPVPSLIYLCLTSTKRLVRNNRNRNLIMIDMFLIGNFLLVTMCMSVIFMLRRTEPLVPLLVLLAHSHSIFFY